MHDALTYIPYKFKRYTYSHLPKLGIASGKPLDVPTNWCMVHFSNIHMIHRSHTHIIYIDIVILVISPIRTYMNKPISIHNQPEPSIHQSLCKNLQHRNSLTLERHQVVSKKQVLVLDLKLLIDLLNQHDGSWMIPFRPSLTPGILGQKIMWHNSGVGIYNVYTLKNEHGFGRYFFFQLGNF